MKLDFDTIEGARLIPPGANKSGYYFRVRGNGKIDGAPSIFGGCVYTREELQAEVDELHELWDSIDFLSIHVSDT